MEQHIDCDSFTQFPANTPDTALSHSWAVGETCPRLQYSPFPKGPVALLSILPFGTSARQRPPLRPSPPDLVPHSGLRQGGLQSPCN